MFSSLACAIAMRVNDGVFFFLGLYSGSLTRGDVFLGLLSSSGVNSSGRVKITVFSFGLLLLCSSLCSAMLWRELNSFVSTIQGFCGRMLEARFLLFLLFLRTGVLSTVSIGLFLTDGG